MYYYSVLTTKTTKVGATRATDLWGAHFGYTQRVQEIQHFSFQKDISQKLRSSDHRYVGKVKICLKFHAPL